MLEIVLTTESEEDIYYYTRVDGRSGKDILENLNYIQTFHEGALSKDSSAGIESALEPGEESDNSTYQHVTIHSDYDHVTWYGLGPEETYADRKKGAKLGVYQNIVQDNLARYIVPQECGAKRKSVMHL